MDKEPIEKEPKEMKEADDDPLSPEENKEMQELMRSRLNEIEEGESAFDITSFLGMRVKIETASIDSGDFGDMIRAETEKLGTYEFEGEQRDIRGSVLFSIYYDEDGKKYFTDQRASWRSLCRDIN